MAIAGQNSDSENEHSCYQGSDDRNEFHHAPRCSKYQRVRDPHQAQHRYIQNKGQGCQRELRAYEMRQHSIHVGKDAFHEFALGLAVNEGQGRSAELATIFQEERGKNRDQY